MHIHMYLYNSSIRVHTCSPTSTAVSCSRPKSLAWAASAFKKASTSTNSVHLRCRSLHQLSTAASVDWVLHENVSGAFSCVCIATTGTASYACSASVVSSLARIGSVELSEPENGCYFDFMFNNCTLISRFMSYMYIKV